MRTYFLPTVLYRYRAVLLTLLLAICQWVALVRFFSGLPILEAGTALPLALMFFFHFTSMAMALKPADLPRTALLWRVLFAANAGCGIVLVPILMRPSPCCRTPFDEAAIVVLELYAPVLLARIGLRSKSLAAPTTLRVIP